MGVRRWRILEVGAAAALWTTTLTVPASATPVLQSFRSCLDPSGYMVAPQDQLLNFTSLWTQFDTGQTEQGVQGSGVQVGMQHADVLRTTLVGTTGSQSEGYSSRTNFLATLITNSYVLNFQAFGNQSALCSSIRMPGFTGGGNTLGNGTNANASTVTNSGCPYGPGDIALGVSIPLQHAYPLTTISTQLRVLDTSTPALTLGCVEIETTPYYPGAYFYKLMLWLPVAITLGYVVVSWSGRIWASKISEQLDREAEFASSLTNRLSDSAWRDRAAVVWWHAWSGQGLLHSGALLRFATPSARDLVWHTQFVASLGMIAVRWPGFVYPAFAKGAWSTLIYNVTLLSHEQDSNLTQIDPLVPPPYTPPSAFAAQFNDLASPLYLNPTLPNVLLDFGTLREGMDRWAATIGLRRQDLFPTCLIVFLAICAGVLALSGVFFLVDLASGLGRQRVDPISSTNGGDEDEDGIGYRRSRGLVNGGQGLNPAPGAAQAPWWQIGRRLTLKGSLKRIRKSEKGAVAADPLAGPSPALSKHLALLQGNFTRLLLLFYYPIVIFSVYQLTLVGTASNASVALAALSFALFGVVAPAVQLLRVRRHAVPRVRSQALVDDMPTVLALGPLYNTYSDRSELFMSLRLLSGLLSGIVIGAAQSSGMAQAIVLLCAELVETSLTSLWLPWGEGAAMGPLTFVLSVSRIITAVLLIVLSPTVAVGPTAAGWLAYVVLLMQGIVYTLLLFVLLVKLVELVLRIAAHIPFDETRSSRSGGLRGALRRWDRGGGRGSRHTRAASIAARRRRGGSRPTSAVMSNGRPRSRASTSVMLDVNGKNTSNPTLGRVGSMGSRHDLYSQPVIPFTDDDGYIMSAMSKGPWLQATPTGYPEGYVSPGHYAARPPLGVHRHSQSLSWSDQPSPGGPSPGFAVVRGGKATEKAPWQMDNNDGRRGDRDYPPWPHQKQSASVGSMGRVRAHSTTADMEGQDAGASDEWAAPGGAGDRLAQSRTTTSLRPPAASGSGAATRPAKRKAKGGIMDRLKRKRRTSVGSQLSEVSTDDDDDEEEEVLEDSRTKAWGLPALGLLGAWRRKGGDDENKPAAGGSTFEVIRPPRPRPSPRSANPGLSASPSEGAPAALVAAPEAGPASSALPTAPATVEGSTEEHFHDADPFASTFAATGGGMPPGAAPPASPGPREMLLGTEAGASPPRGGSRRGSAAESVATFFDAEQAPTGRMPPRI